MPVSGKAQTFADSRHKCAWNFFRMPTEQNMMDNNRFFVSLFYLTCFVACVKVFKRFFLEVTFDEALTQTELGKAGLWPPECEFFLHGPHFEGTSPLSSPVSIPEAEQFVVKVLQQRKVGHPTKHCPKASLKDRPRKESLSLC